MQCLNAGAYHITDRVRCSTNDNSDTVLRSVAVVNLDRIFLVLGCRVYLLALLVSEYEVLGAVLET